ncbi:hypothetical protein FQZ97_608120 [compost metagenome]
MILALNHRQLLSGSKGVRDNPPSSYRTSVARRYLLTTLWPDPCGLSLDKNHYA